MYVKYGMHLKSMKILYVLFKRTPMDFTSTVFSQDGGKEPDLCHLKKKDKIFLKTGQKLDIKKNDGLWSLRDKGINKVSLKLVLVYYVEKGRSQDNPPKKFSGVGRWRQMNVWGDECGQSLQKSVPECTALQSALQTNKQTATKL